MGVVAADPIAVTASAVFAVIYLRTSLRNLSPMERPDAVHR
jgi:hypothetical protein